ncbi:MAG: redoxin domain-containing protein [Anaerolineales bacterium]|nr:redoxin domain-containing protein [Anaerolineales bacterium]
MPRVSINQIAPNFTLPDFNGNPFQLTDLRGQKNVLLVFNRTFV